MKLALCNEVIRELDFSHQCTLCAELGYDGIELAPFTLGDEPHMLTEGRRAEVRKALDAAGLELEGLHWLLVTPQDLSITTADKAVRDRTIDVMRRLIALCHDLGGSLLVHGSPGQRRLPDGPDAEEARKRGDDAYAAIAGDAEAAGVTYCIEPLAPRMTNYLNTLEETTRLVEAIGSPAVRTMLDTCSASHAESLDIPALIDRWMPTGLVRHVQVNDYNDQGPGQGRMKFAPIMEALIRNGYDDWIAVEPFDYVPDGPGAAARAVGYLQGVLEAVRWRA